MRRPHIDVGQRATDAAPSAKQSGEGGKSSPKAWGDHSTYGHSMRRSDCFTTTTARSSETSQSIRAIENKTRAQRFKDDDSHLMAQAAGWSPRTRSNTRTQQPPAELCIEVEVEPHNTFRTAPAAAPRTCQLWSASSFAIGAGSRNVLAIKRAAVTRTSSESCSLNAHKRARALPL